MGNPRHERDALPAGEKLFGARGRIAVHARQRVFEPAHRIVHQRLFQPRHRAVADHALMHEVAGEIRLVPPEQPQHVVGRPAGVIHQTPAESSTAAAARSHPRPPPRWHCRISCASVGRHALVGIDRQHPVAGRQRQRKSLLRAEPFERMRHHPRALALRDLRRFVGAAAVNHDALVAERKRVETVRDIAGLVQRDDDGAQSRHDPRALPPTSPRRAAGPGARHCAPHGTAAQDSICAGFPSGRTSETVTARRPERTSRCGRAGE